MNKVITLKYKDSEYTLRYTRKSIASMEQKGFILGELETKPVTMIPKLFYGAFLADQPRMKQSETDEILDSLSGNAALIERLATMYSEPLEALLEGKTNKNGKPDEGNAVWEANW